MANKLITALKENKNDARKKLAIAVTVTAAAIAAGIILTKIANDQREILLVSPVEVGEAVTIDVPTE